MLENPDNDTYRTLRFFRREQQQELFAAFRRNDRAEFNRLILAGASPIGMFEEDRGSIFFKSCTIL